MKRLASLAGHTGAVLALAAALLTPFLLLAWFQKAVGSAGLRIDPGYSGGDFSHAVERGGYRILVNRPIPRTSRFQRIQPFVQLTWTPAARLPAQVSDAVDIDGDGKPDVLVRFDGKTVEATPLSPGYAPMRSAGVTSFSAMIARVRDGIVVRIPLAAQPTS